MNNLIKKIIFFVLVIFFFSISFANSQISLKILYKLNNEIITNIDLKNEKNFLKFLNPGLNNLTNDQINKISINSLQNRKIKEIELKKYFDFNKKDLGNQYVENFASNSQYKNIDMLKKNLSDANIEFDYFKTNLMIDNLWREFIFNKFRSQVKLNIDLLKKQIENQETQIEELNISEILFEIKTDISFEEFTNQIYAEIEKSGFEAAASIFSKSNTKNTGGNLG